MTWEYRDLGTNVQFVCAHDELFVNPDADLQAVRHAMIRFLLDTADINIPCLTCPNMEKLLWQS